MKKFVFVVFVMTFFALNSNVFAGKMKNLVMDAEDAIYSEFYENGDRSVVSMSEHKLVSSLSGVAVKILVVTRNIHNGYNQTWTCVVDFKKNLDDEFEVADLNCRQ